MRVITHVKLIYTPKEYLYSLELAKYLSKKSKGNRQPIKSDHLTVEDIVSKTAKGFCAQFAVARYLGIDDYMPTVDTYRDAPDIEPFYEVRHSEHNPIAFGIVQLNDRDGDYCVVTYGWPEIYLAGYIPVKLAKTRYRAENHFGRNAFHKVPVGDLWPM